MRFTYLPSLPSLLQRIGHGDDPAGGPAMSASLLCIDNDVASAASDNLAGPTNSQHVSYLHVIIRNYF